MRSKDKLNVSMSSYATRVDDLCWGRMPTALVPDSLPVSQQPQLLYPSSSPAPAAPELVHHHHQASIAKQDPLVLALLIIVVILAFFVVHLNSKLNAMQTMMTYLAHRAR